MSRIGKCTQCFITPGTMDAREAKRMLGLGDDVEILEAAYCGRCKVAFVVVAGTAG